VITLEEATARVTATHLADRLGELQRADIAEVTGNVYQTVRYWERNGLTIEAADRVATLLGRSGCMIWGDAFYTDELAGSAVEAPHGTAAGIRLHLTVGEPLCTACDLTVTFAVAGAA
jgi:hypothetical protein